MLANYSLDEDKIFERILADNWEAKDRLVILHDQSSDQQIVQDLLRKVFVFLQVGKGSCKAAKEGLSCSEKALCLSRGEFGVVLSTVCSCCDERT